MNVLYISNSIIPSRSANSIHVMKMCQALAENGNKVVLIAPNKIKNEKQIVDSYKYYGVKNNFIIKKLWSPDIKGGAFFYTLSVCFYMMFNHNFELIYGRFLYGCYLATLFKKKVIYESHAPIYEETKYGLSIFKRLVKSKFFEKLVVISEALKDIYLEKQYLLEEKIQVAHDGADKVLDLKTKIKLRGEDQNLKLGYIGHLHKGKGLEIISSIANKVSNDIEFHVVGGLDKDVSLWKKKIKEKNVFFYGWVPHCDVGKYINAMDVCLLPNQKIVFAFGSSEDGMNLSKFTSPLKMFEYMSHNKAIIASDLTVLREVLNEKNSLLVKCDDTRGWLKAIEKLKIPKNRELLAKQAFNDFSLYTWKKRAKNIMNLN